MRKQIVIALSVFSITACILSGCGSNNNKVREAASAGEVSLETTIEAESEAETTTVQNAKLEEKTTKEDTTMIESSATENTAKPSAEATIESTTSSTEVATTVYIQPQTEAPVQELQTQVVVQATEPETTTAYVEPQTEVQTPAPEPQTQDPAIKETEQVTQAPAEPPTEKETERQKTQEEYLEEFKANYMALRKEVCGDAPQWNETLYKIAKLRADELDYYFDHYSPNGYLNGYDTLECITQWHGYAGAFEGWCKSSEHYTTLCYAGKDIWAVAVGKGGCVFLSASSDDWCAEAYADTMTDEAKKELKEYAINECGANKNNWKQVLEEQVLWRICKDEDGNERFDITYEQCIEEEWNNHFNWYTEHYGEKVVPIVE